MREYLTVNHPDAFLDHPEKAQPVEHHPEWTVKCPACLGHGGWNLRVNAYPLHQHENTPENRHLHAHFRCHCSQCSGWGWTTPADAGCVHDYAKQLSYKECQERGIYHAGSCWHVYECSKCGSTLSEDSSD
jgi:hypothetical protein